MSRFSIFTIFSLALLMGCTSDKQAGAGKPGSGSPETVAATQVGDYELQPAINVGSIQIIPVTNPKSTPKEQDGDFMTLEEAKKLDVVEITELGDGDVNSLRVTNRGARPLLLLGGDLLLGGKQDRIVARDTIVQPGKTEIVEVYCVEHGRWDGASKHFEYKSTVVPSKVREAAAFEDQSAVWGEVSSFNKSQGAVAASDTVNAGLDSEAVKKAVDENVPKILAELEDRKDLVGFVYLLNGELQSADLFGSPRIMAQAKESLLKGYLAEGSSTEAKPNLALDWEAIRGFMKDVVEGRESRMPALQMDTSGLYRGRDTRGVEMKSAAAGGGFVHGSYSPNR